MRIYEHLHEPVEQVLDAATAVTPGRPKPLNCDSFVARSIMQKAIRRGDAPLALRAAATLTLTDSTVVWRRLLVTALEDLGIHELSTLLRLAAAMERRRLGHRYAEEWPIIATVIAEFCSGTRCQAANDLHNLAVNDSCHDAFRQEAGRMASGELLRFVGCDENDLIERNIAILTLLGADHAPGAKSGTTAEARSVIEAAGGRLCPLIQSLYEWAFKKSGLSLATASLLLIGQGGRGVQTCWTNDPLPPPCLIGEVPAFALDQYTWLGRAAIGDFVNSSGLWRSYVGGAWPVATDRAIGCRGTAVPRRRSCADQTRNVGFGKGTARSFLECRLLR